MIEKVLSAYRQISYRSPHTACAKRSAFLQVAPLEERATPTAAPGLLPPVEPAPMVWIAPLLRVDMMIPATGLAVSQGATEINVRADLYGGSECGDRQQ